LRVRAWIADFPLGRPLFCWTLASLLQSTRYHDSVDSLGLLAFRHDEEGASPKITDTSTMKYSDVKCISYCDLLSSKKQTPIMIVGNCI
jgi:hypothetical protein